MLNCGILFVAFEQFKIDDSDDIDALILDQDGVQIPIERFGSLVKQFINCGSFYINIELLNRPNTSSAQVRFIIEMSRFWFQFLCYFILRSSEISWPKMDAYQCLRSTKVWDFCRKKIARNWSMVYMHTCLLKCLWIQRVKNILPYAMTCCWFFLT